MPGGSIAIQFGDDDIVDLALQENYEFPHPIQNWVMPLVGAHTDAEGQIVDLQPLGTAFAIASGGLLVTAKHVIEDAAREGLSVLVIVAGPDETRDGAGGQICPVRHASINDGHDLAVLTVAAAARFKAAPLTIDPPRPATKLLVLGYPGSTTVREGGAVTLRQTVTAARGDVGQIYPSGRDKVMINFPAVEGSYPSPSGMSGGPVIREDGFVCGVVATALEPTEGSAWTSTASLLPWLFSLTANVSVAEQPERSWTLVELANVGVIPTDGTYQKLVIEYVGEKINIGWPLTE